MIQSEEPFQFMLQTELQIVINQKYGTSQKISIEQQPNKSTFPFAIKDIHFPHSPSSLSPSVDNLALQWKRAQSFCEKANYSDDIDNLEKPCFSNRAITHALLLLNWFVTDGFENIFAQRKIKTNCLYEYKVMVKGMIMKLYVDSYIPLVQGKQIFAQNIDNSIFPCLYEKLLAKIYGSYEAISQDPIDILEIHTTFSKQIVPFYTYEKQQFLNKFNQCHLNNDLIFFRTRNSVGLQTVGLQSNQCFVITRFLKVKNIDLCQFLEIDGEGWIGKFSKVRSFWRVSHPQIEENDLNLQEFARQNYMSLKDLIGVSREFIILHNTDKYHKNWVNVQNLKLKHCFLIKTEKQNHIYLNLNFQSLKCRSSLVLIRETDEKQLCYSFKEEKESNFLQATLDSNEKYYLFVEVEDISGKSIPYNLTIFSSGQLISPIQIQPNQMIQEKAYLKFVMSSESIKTQIGNNGFIYVKNCNKELGKCFIGVLLSKQFKGKMKIEINHEELKKCGIQIVNTKEKILQYKRSFKTILIFKQKGKVREKVKFPPEESLKIFIQGKKISSLL